ncbi:hypothetical protein PENTCL1PPCAC_11290 [Pristionchus entomophagus]|uniref:Uncharacterized protein n=1 Tax=Pristionchus entomophagus TaxID=358040 RepID=A0AAV5T9T0_9BILA|nr:hypothetical protein PENTCL1PPCAC_11290 [Pristionchus entomophagus]
MNLKKMKDRMDVSLAHAIDKVEKKAKKQYKKVVGEGRKRREEREEEEETEWDESRDESRLERVHTQQNSVIPPSIDEVTRRNEELESRNERMRREMVDLRSKILRMEEEKKEGDKRYRRVLLMVSGL